MSDEIRVKVNSYGPGRPLGLVYFCPLTNKKICKSSGTRDWRTAERAAAKLEKELREGTHRPASKTTWEDFTRRYSDDVLPGLAPKTRKQLNTVFAMVERLAGPKLLAHVTAGRLSEIAGALRREDKSEYTIRNYLAHLKSAMRWAASVGLLAAVPAFPKVQRAKRGKTMKGRPITAEEFDRLLGVVGKVLTGQDRAKGSKGRKTDKPREADAAAVASWRYYLEGLWWSGLRLRESLALSWEPRVAVSVDLSGKYPMLRIRGDSQKSGRDQLYPVAPEFGEMLLAVPEGERRGRVFKLLGAVNPNGGPASMGPVTDPDYVSHVVSRIGEAAGVKVDSKMKAGKGEVVKFASAHDLRRSFGFRWSRRIMPPELRELMRHADIATTMAFYVGQDAESTAGALWAAYRKPGAGNVGPAGNSFGNNGRGASTLPIPETTQALENQGLVKYTPLGSNQ
jgi:integrase